VAANVTNRLRFCRSASIAFQIKFSPTAYLFDGGAFGVLRDLTSCKNNPLAKKYKDSDEI